MQKTQKVFFKRFDKELPIPSQATAGAAGIDLYARETVTINPQEVALVPLNVGFKLPQGHWVLLAARSSLHKQGVLLANGIGVGDEDYCGDNDEYKAALLNYRSEPVTITRGERIVQMILMSKVLVELEEVEKLGSKDRGGFGTTGKK